ncbi:MAG: C39 family peptidase [Propionibacteriales bacterium]|nr:C39 family peptidase [Propionibacteriales bacterium]
MSSLPPENDNNRPFSALPRRTLLGGALIAGAGLAMGSDPRRADAAPARPIEFTVWDRTDHFQTGYPAGCLIDGRGGLIIGKALKGFTYTDPHTRKKRSYDRGEWVSPLVTPRFRFTELITSINATTPSGTWVDVAVQGLTASGRWTRWLMLGRWTSGDGADDIRRTSLDGQVDGLVKINTDTLMTTSGETMINYKVRVRLFRIAGTTSTPRVGLVSAVASAIPKTTSVPTSASSGAWGKTVNVPTYSQELHKGHYPQYDGGGEAWCSPTCTAMILDHWQRGPKASELSWVRVTPENRRQVDHAARQTFDHQYGGTGNWTFNTAYAGQQGLRSYVTRLKSLREVEGFITAGVPLVVSLSFTSAQLSGAGYGTNGHLLVIVGFTRTGDVVVNDPASHLQKSDAQVRTTYRRGQFENVWQTSSGGIAYVMAPWGHRLPAAAPNWS